jgi:hypothetical protein
VDNVGDLLRNVWRALFTLAGRTTRGNPWFGEGWGIFVLFWVWAIVGAIPGALLAAYIIGRFHIADQRLQDVVSVGLAFVSMLLVQTFLSLALFWGLLWGVRLNLLRSLDDDTLRNIREISQQEVEGGAPSTEEYLEQLPPGALRGLDVPRSRGVPAGACRAARRAGHRARARPQPHHAISLLASHRRGRADAALARDESPHAPAPEGGPP